MKYNQGRNLQLDILRTLAVFLVFGRHLELPPPSGTVGSFAKAWFQIGWLGVDLFFVLSGFLIGGLLVTELHHHGKINIQRFLVRRGLKIYPPYVVFVAYLILMPSVKAMRGGGDFWASVVAEWNQYWPNFLFLQNYIGTNPAGHTWTLAVEEHFYLSLPFALVLLAAVGRVRALIPLCVLAVPAVVFTLRGLSVMSGDMFSVRMAATHLRVDALLFGVGIRAVAQYLPERFLAARTWRGPLFGLGILLWTPNLIIDPGTAFIRIFGLGMNYLGAACFLLAAYHTHAEDFGRWKPFAVPVAKAVGAIGVYSYAIYLWHVTAMGGLNRVVASRILSWAGGVTPGAWLICAVVLCVGAVVAGVITTKLVEWPVLRIRDRFFPSRSRPLPVAAPMSSEPGAPKVLHAAVALAPKAE